MIGFVNHPLCLPPPGGRPTPGPRLVVIVLACLASVASVAAEEKPLVPRPMTVIEAVEILPTIQIQPPIE